MAFPTTFLEARYEAKDESGYTDGQVATTVTDQTANARNLAGTGLTWQANVLNGHAVYRLDGVDDNATDNPNGGTHTAWSVSVLAKAAAEGSTRTWPFYTGDSTARIMAFTEGETASEWGIFARSDAATQKVATSGVDTTVWAALLIVWDGATVSFYRDNTLVDSVSLSGNFVWGDTILGEGVSEFFGGDIALAAAWSKALTSTERADLQDYVDSTYFGAGGTVNELAGGIAGSGTISGDLHLLHALAGDIAGVGSLSGALLRTRDLTGELAGVGSLSGSILRVRDLAGELAGTGTLAGNLTVVTGTHELSGTIAGVATLSGDLHLLHALSGELAGVGSLSGSILRVRDLAGELAGTGTLEGTLIAVRNLTGEIVGVATLEGSILRTRDLTGELAGQATLTGAILLVVDHGAPGPLRVDIDPYTTEAALDPSLTSVELDPSITHVTVDQDRTTT